MIISVSVANNKRFVVKWTIVEEDESKDGLTCLMTIQLCTKSPITVTIILKSCTMPEGMKIFATTALVTVSWWRVRNFTHSALTALRMENRRYQ